MTMIPMVIDNSGRGERVYDIYSLLLKERIVFLGTGINDAVANVIVAQLLYLNSIDQKSQISLYINSPGGSVYAGLAIYDAMQMIQAPVSTVAVGVSASMGTALLASGAKGKRLALPHATIHMHPTGGGAQGYTEDVRIATREQERLQTQLFHLMGKHSGHTWKEIEEYFLRDKFLNAPEAKAFGLIDEVLGDTSDVVLLQNADVEVKLFQPSALTVGAGNLLDHSN
ncbi:ClpP family protease [Chryseolinea soli]|uniref:ATP-dependent Clp protease proteolytic subunit n=1 Tax=Chryseolinea soli TaxID=2321403 RepID=A0A385SG52_9BACT|nr:ATP-dependent Clp protease proteolytic subunit [Chryseolinea soli]AYB30209.1 ATP-dependent Clp protease proteolytic subunit [Chryseolinea soli]